MPKTSTGFTFVAAISQPLLAHSDSPSSLPALVKRSRRRNDLQECTRCQGIIYLVSHRNLLHKVQVSQCIVAFVLQKNV